MANEIKEAFFQTCNNAEKAVQKCVSLYISVPFYGGPEEGGWWGSDTHLVAYQVCETEAEAEEKHKAVKELADKLSKEEKDRFGDRCLQEMQWLEERGLDADFLPEVDGESSYFVTVEDNPGENSHIGSRHWE